MESEKPASLLFEARKKHTFATVFSATVAARALFKKNGNHEASGLVDEQISIFSLDYSLFLSSVRQSDHLIKQCSDDSSDEDKF